MIPAGEFVDASIYHCSDGMPIVSAISHAVTISMGKPYCEMPSTSSGPMPASSNAASEASTASCATL